METKTKTILSIMEVLAWVIFIGMCIKTGALLFTTMMSLFFKPLFAGDLYLGLDLSELLAASQWKYICALSLIIFLSAQKAYFFFLVTRLFSKFNIAHPFSSSVFSLLIKLSYYAFGIGIVAIIANEYFESLIKNGFKFSDIHDYLNGAQEYFFMAGIIFIIAQVFKRGLEIQSENELTI